MNNLDGSYWAMAGAVVGFILLAITVLGTHARARRLYIVATAIMGCSALAYFVSGWDGVIGFLVGLVLPPALLGFLRRR